jgi:hypothetical protein
MDEPWTNMHGKKTWKGIWINNPNNNKNRHDNIKTHLANDSNYNNSKSSSSDSVNRLNGVKNSWTYATCRYWELNTSHTVTVIRLPQTGSPETQCAAPTPTSSSGGAEVDHTQQIRAGRTITIRQTATSSVSPACYMEGRQEEGTCTNLK